MIALALCWLFLLRASTAAGDLILGFVGAATDGEDHWFVAFWTGLLALASLALAITIFAPAPYSAPLLLLALLPRASAPRNSPPRWFWAIAAAMTYTSSGPVRLYDTALYHQPVIEWMSSRGLVPGLALIHFRFGFTSSWLALTSLFDVGPLSMHASTVVTGLALSAALSHWVDLFRRNNSPATRFYVAGLPALLFFFFLDSAIVSPSPNLASGLAVFLGLWMLQRPSAKAAGAIAAAGALAIKLSAAPLLLAAVFGAWRERRAMALAGVLVAPFLLANYQTTGCPLFPAALACVEQPSSLPASEVRSVAFETLHWARYAGAYPRDAAYLSLDWLPHYLASPRNAIVAVLTVLSLVALAVRRQFTWAVGAAVLGTIYVYAAAPDPRFGAGFLLALPALALSTMTLPTFPWLHVQRRTLTIALASILTAGAFIGERISNARVPEARYRFTLSRLLIPAPAWMPESTVSVRHNGVPITRPLDTDRCGAAPHPCTPYDLPPSLRRDGRGWRR